MFKILSCFLVIQLSLISFFTKGCYASFTDKPGARPLGMGEAFVSISDDMNSLFYNPAGLGFLKRTGITTIYDQQYIGLGVNLNYAYLAAVQPLENYGTFGLSVSQSYSELYQEYMIGLSYGTKILQDPRLFAGANIKWLMKKYVENEYTRIDPLYINNGTSKIGISIDTGFLLYLSRKFSIGVMLENINRPDMMLGNTQEKLGLNLKIGCAYRFSDFIAALEFNKKTSKINGIYDDNILGGMEYKLSDYMDLRIGGNLYNLSTGFAYKTENLQFDYVFRYPIGGIAYTYGSHGIQLTYKFGTFNTEQPLSKAVLSLKKGVKKISIAVYDLQTNTLASDTLKKVYELLNLNFNGIEKYTVMNKKEINAILDRQISLPAADEEKLKAEITAGKLLKVNYIVTGTVNKIKDQFVIVVKVLDIEKSKAVLVDMAECGSASQFPEIIKELFNRINSQINTVGKVIKVGNDSITVDKGTLDKIETGMIFPVERETVHDGIYQEIAIIEVIEADEYTFKGRIIHMTRGIKEGDIINLKFID